MTTQNTWELKDANYSESCELLGELRATGQVRMQTLFAPGIHPKIKQVAVF